VPPHCKTIVRRGPLTPTAVTVKSGVVHVVVLTPVVSGGQGGIARLMETIREELERAPRPQIAATFVSTRGTRRLGVGTFARGLMTVWRLCRKGQCDVLHINLASRGSTYRKLVFARLAAYLRVPYVVHLHGGHFEEFWESRGPRLSAAIRQLYERAARVLVLGRVWAEMVRRNAPAAADRVDVLPNASPRATRRRDSAAAAGTARVLFLGRLGSQKGTDHLVEALASLRHLDWRATLAGNGDVEGTRDAIARLGLQEKVEAPGWVAPSKAAELLETSDVLVLPSREENLPMSIVEAFAHGIAVISTPVGSIPDLVEDGITGLLVPVGDVPALSEALRRLIVHRDLRQRLGEAARDVHRTRLELSVYVDRLAAIWADAAADGLAQTQARPADAR
jgi:glycosyltransferase involved in cell wall biosynthesis